MKLRALGLLLALAAGLPAERSAPRLLLGELDKGCDCPTATPTLTPSPTLSPTPTETSSFTLTETPSPSPSPSITLTPAVTPTLKEVLQSRGFLVREEGAAVLLVTLPDELLNFDTDKAELKAAGSARLGDLAEVLLLYPGNKVDISGHTDKRGGQEHNLALSLRRADAVRDALRQRGLEAGLFGPLQGRGPEQPLADNASEEGRAQNRRVELRLRLHQFAAPAP